VRCGSPRFFRSRSPVFPDAPTIAESGFPGFEASVWYGFVAPDVRERMAAVGGEVSPGSVEEFGRLIGAERLRYERLIRAANLVPD
jgi:tripartite-type tricarboxylate transporter receptor subunit TctC